MDTAKICKNCLRPLPTDAPEGLCPACLAKVALDIEPPTPTPTINITPLASQAAPLGQLRYFGDYELLEEIARGGMGVVYKARQVSLNRIVAVKMILAGQLASPADVKRFRTEAAAAAQLQHPNIVAIHEVGEHQGQQYFSMDFVSGSSLAARLGNEAIPIGEAVLYMKAIAEAVHFAHLRGILHRDLKPANVLLDEFGRPHITDFGLAKRFDCGERLTASGAMLGTPDYMSPEQAAGRQDIIGPTGDVFSLGAMLYEMITGGAPFRGSNLPETLSNILQNEPVPPSRMNPRVPPDLETICLKCLEKRPDRRYPTAEALAKDLGRFLDHETLSARPVGTSRQVSRWFVGHPKILAALASGVLLALVWFGYGLWTENRILAWELLHPTELKPASAWSKSEEISQSFVFLVVLVLGLMRRLQDQLARRTRARVMTGRFVSSRVLDAFGLAGVAGVVLSIYLGAAGIESWRWAKYALSRERKELTAELAAEAHEKELYELSQNKLEKLAKKQFQKPAIQRNFVWEKAELASISQLQSQEQDAALKARALGSSFLKTQEIIRLQNLSGRGIWEVLLATVSAWLAATLALKAFREQRFAFYLSAEEEQTALSLALLEYEKAAEKERGRLRSLRFLVSLVGIMALSCPYLYWLQDKDLSGKAPFLVGELSAFTLALIVSLQGWRGSSRWEKRNRFLLAMLALIVVIALFIGSASLAGRGMALGAGTGASIGLFFLWTRKKISVLFPTPDCGKGSV